MPWRPRASSLLDDPSSWAVDLHGFGIVVAVMPPPSRDTRRSNPSASSSRPRASSTAASADIVCSVESSSDPRTCVAVSGTREGWPRPLRACPSSLSASPRRRSEMRVEGCLGPKTARLRSRHSRKFVSASAYFSCFRRARPRASSAFRRFRMVRTPLTSLRFARSRRRTTSASA